MRAAPRETRRELIERALIVTKRVEGERVVTPLALTALTTANASVEPSAAGGGVRDMRAATLGVGASGVAVDCRGGCGT